MKLRSRNKEASPTLDSSPGSQGSITSTTRRLPAKGCIRRSGSDSDYSGASCGASIMSSHSSVRSETEKSYDQSASLHSQAGGSGESWVPQQESLDEQRNRGTAQAMRSLASASTGSSKSKRVQFSVVEIRDYEREVGDNPSCSNGCPIG